MDPISSAGLLPYCGVEANNSPAKTGKVYRAPFWFWRSDKSKVAFLRRLADAYGAQPQMRYFTVKVLERYGAAPRDYQSQAAAILQFAQNEIYYANESGEQIQSPYRTIKEGTGDCDDLALLMASMAESIALPNKFALGGQYPNGKPVRWIEGEPFKKADYVHVYLYLGWPPFTPKQWASAEPTVRGLPLGHDVVTDGLPNGVSGSDISYGSGYGSWGAIADPKEKTVWSEFIDGIKPANLVRPAIEGIVIGSITAVAVPAVLAWFGRKE